MANALPEAALKAESKRPVHRRPTALLIATDGTPQSDAAIAFARLLPLGESWSLLIVLVLATVLSVATPIKIWNNARIEHRLQEQEKLLLAATSKF